MSVQVEKDDRQLAKELLSPILSVFGAEDGGVAFAKLQHSFLPQVVAAAKTEAQQEAMLKMVKQFSKLCEIMLKGDT